MGTICLRRAFAVLGLFCTISCSHVEAAVRPAQRVNVVLHVDLVVTPIGGAPRTLASSEMDLHRCMPASVAMGDSLSVSSAGFDSTSRLQVQFGLVRATATGWLVRADVTGSARKQAQTYILVGPGAPAVIDLGLWDGPQRLTAAVTID